MRLAYLSPFFLVTAVAACADTARDFPSNPGGSAGAAGSSGGSETAAGGAAGQQTAAGGGAGEAGAAGRGGEAGNGGSSSGNGGSSGVSGAGSGGGAGASSTFCEQQAIPSDVAESDYRCLDFDLGLPTTDDWEEAVTGTAALTATEDRAFSLPMSLRTSVPSASMFSETTTAMLTFDTAGANPVQSVSIAAEVNPSLLQSLAIPWTGSIDLLCATSGGTTVCLSYTLGEEYVGPFIGWSFVGGIALYEECEVTTDFDFDLWNSVVLELHNEGEIVLSINGVPSLADCAPTTADSTVSEVEIGLQSHAATSSGWSVYFDNVVVATRRAP